jgi:hypothetical protein
MARKVMARPDTTRPSAKTTAEAISARKTGRARSGRGLFSFETLRQPLVSRRVFLVRMAWSVAIWFAIMLFGLAVGMAGYAGFEGMNLVDAYLNAAMILSGMGPVSELHTQAGKVFAGTYAIFSGLIIVLATGVVLAPIIHHVLHAFHVDMDDDGKPD